MVKSSALRKRYPSLCCRGHDPLELWPICEQTEQVLSTLARFALSPIFTKLERRVLPPSLTASGGLRNCLKSSSEVDALGTDELSALALVEAEEEDEAALEDEAEGPETEPFAVP